MLRYAITDRRMFPGDQAAQLVALLEQAKRWTGAGVDVLQLREKDLDPEELEELLRRLRTAVPAGSRPKLLLNAAVGEGSWTGDVTEVCGMVQRTGADGVHLPGGWTAQTVAAVRSGTGADWKARLLVSAACHSPDEARAAAGAGADLILFSPVFEKREAGRAPAAGVGISRLREAVREAAGTSVLALGGVTKENAAACLAAGAAGIAGIRLFGDL